MSEFRHEWKHEISYLDRRVIRARMQAVARPDPHAVNGRYFIRSLYFDSPNDRALRDKLDGVSFREKFRIRYYNNDLSFIHLEKKGKQGGLGTKEQVLLRAEEAGKIAEGDLDWIGERLATEEAALSEGEVSSTGTGCLVSQSGGAGTAGGNNRLMQNAHPRPLLQELYRRMLTEGLRAKVIVDYTREPFIYDPGNVRVTLDYNIRTGLRNTDFLNPDAVTIPAYDSPIILEVKWDEYLPGIIKDAVQLPNRRAGAFSKYASCRMYE